MSRGELSISRWLEAHTDRSAALTTLPRNAVLADVTGDGDYRLVITDVKFEKDTRCRLKVYKGTVLTSDQILQDIPNSVICFYVDELQPRIPAVAVACASDLFIYKNNKPFYKFKVPSYPIEPLESELWNKTWEEKCLNVEEFLAYLKNIPYSYLSSRSQHLLCEPISRAEDFIRMYAGTTPIKNNLITCLSSIKRSSHEKRAIGCPVIGTEFGNIYILDPQNFTILHQANPCNTKATPFIIQSVGLFDIEFRIFIASRERSVCVLRRGWLEGKTIIQMTEDIVDMIIIPGDNFIMVATVDKTLHCFTKRGQRLWSTQMINSISCLCLVPLEHFSTHLVAVGLKGGTIHLYQNRHMVDYTSASGTPSLIVFGQLGQEEHVMVIITLDGAINFKILKRTADFNTRNQDITPSIQSKPLPLPKRSKLFLEQSLRERQNAVEMHQTFQQDLIRLRLTAATALVQNISDQTGVGNKEEQIKLSAQVLGLGPKFTIILTLQNMNSEKPIVGFTLIFHANSLLYTLSSYVQSIPFIPPSLSYKIQTRVEEKLEESNGDNGVTNIASFGQVIRVFVIKNEQTQPVLAATINMPPTEFVV